MGHYHWAGPGQMEEVGLTRAVVPEITEPASPDAIGEVVEKMKLHVCTVEGCGKRFKRPMIIARHFNSNHEDLREDKDSWRKHSREVWE